MKGERNAKIGNKYLSWALVEAAHFAMRFCPEAKRFYAKKYAKTNGAATKALAHKLARAWSRYPRQPLLCTKHHGTTRGTNVPLR